MENSLIKYYKIEFEGYEPFSLKTNYKRMVNKVLYLVEDFLEIDRKYIKSIKETTQNEAEKFPIITVLRGK